MSSASASPASDRALLAAFAREGDVEALRELVERVSPPLFRAARGLTGWRLLGAQTVVEDSWRAVLRRSRELFREEGALRRLLWEEVIRRAQQMGDSPRPKLEREPPARADAMRAVALLPRPSRSVLVLHDIGGLPLLRVSELLGLPPSRIVAELWHARLAVETLRGGSAAATPPAEPVEAANTPEDEPPPVAEIWEEPVPDELVERVCERAAHRRALRASLPGPLGENVHADGGFLLLVASVALGAWALGAGELLLPDRDAGSPAYAAYGSGGAVCTQELPVLPVLPPAVAKWPRPETAPLRLKADSLVATGERARSQRSSLRL